MSSRIRLFSGFPDCKNGIQNRKHHQHHYKKSKATNPRPTVTVPLPTSPESKLGGVNTATPLASPMVLFHGFQFTAVVTPKPNAIPVILHVEGVSIRFGTEIIETTLVFLSCRRRSRTPNIIGRLASTNKMVTFTMMHCFVSRPWSRREFY